ncbi:putative transport protein [Aspergillus floccosus]
MAISTVFVAVDAAYPLVLAATYLGSSIFLKVNHGRTGKTPNEVPRSRQNWIFRFNLLLAVNFASEIAVFLFFAASLLPDPDTPYQPSLTNAHTWLTALGFELPLAVVFSFCRPPQITSHHSLGDQGIYTAMIVLAYTRILFLSSSSILFFLAPRTISDPEGASLLAGHQDESSYGTVGQEPTKRPTTADAQSTNWLDYLVGFGQLLPLIWPADSVSLQIRACICVLILALQRVVNVLVPFQLGEVVTALGSGQIPYKELSIYIACRAVQGQQGVLASIRALLWIPIGQATYRRLTQSAFEHVMSLSLQFHLGKKLGEVISALSKGSALNTFIDSLIFQLFPMVADIGVAAAYFLVKFDPFYSLIILTVGGTYLFVTIYMAKYRGRARREMVTRDREMDAIKTDAIMSYEVVHYNGALQAEQSRFADRISGFQKSEFSVLVSLNLLNAAQNMIFTMGVVMVSFLSAWRISIGAEDVAMFVSLLAYLAQLQAPLGFFGSFYTQIQNNLIDAERMLSLFEESPSVVDKPGARDITDCKGHITFDRVSFAYDPRREALRDISLDIPPGTSVAIVGESGSGKSTLLRLLFRFYDVNSGRILLDGVDIQEFTIQSLRDHFGVVPQDTILFNDTLMYNLLYANPEASEEDIYAACRAASVHDKIMALPDGYNTQVGERGLRLSGGEKQRISIARSILKSPTIILMDEATASLDSETEKAIQTSLAQISVGRTTITIAHRLSTIVDCDRIVVLHDGQIVEQGTHAELLARNGRYQKMWEKQTKDSSGER